MTKVYKAVSQSRAVAKRKILAGHWTIKLGKQNARLLHWRAVVWVRKPNFGSFYRGQPFVDQVWLSSDPPEFFTFSYCARLWNWRVERTKLQAKWSSSYWNSNEFSFVLYQLTFKGTAGSSYTSDAAIDDVSLKPCSGGKLLLDYFKTGPKLST